MKRYMTGLSIVVLSVLLVPMINTPQASALTIPLSPTGLTATTVSPQEIDLSWTDTVNIGDSPITGHKIERSTDDGFTWSTIVANTASTSTTDSDTGLAANTKYTYRVSEINLGGISLPSNTASATTYPTTATITVTSVYSDGKSLTGMYIVLKQNGNTIATGFTPITFTVSFGQSYMITAADYINAYFNHWGDGTQSRSIYMTVLNPSNSLQAIYTTTPQPAPSGTPGGPNSVTVNSSYLTAATLNGMYAELRLDGNTLAGGFTPMTFTNLATAPYQIVMYSGQDNYMRHFSDGTLIRYHYVTPGAGPITLNAMYENVPSASSAQLNVNAFDTLGHPINGLWMGLTPPGQTTQYTASFTGASDVPFVIFNGQTYRVQMGSFGIYMFDHWQDNLSTNPVRDFAMNGNSINNNAIYRIG